MALVGVVALPRCDAGAVLASGFGWAEVRAGAAVVTGGGGVNAKGGDSVGG